MDKQQEQLIQAFMLDLGIVLGAKNEQEALQTGQAAVQKLGENAGKLFQAWGQAESQQQGAGRQVIAEALGGGQKQAAPAQSSLIGSMSPTLNAAPTPTPYGDNPNAAISAKKGAKLAQLNGKCPEGYEVEKYLVGGCVKCKKKKQLALTEELKCGGKKRIKKGDKGLVSGTTRTTKNGITKTEHVGADDSNNNAKTITYLGKKYTSQAYIPDTSKKDTLWSTDNNVSIKAENENKKRFYQHLSIYNSKPTKKENGGLMEFLKCGGKKYIKKAANGDNLTKTYMNALKYQGGPGDINSTQGMPMNNKQKKRIHK